MKYGEKPKPPKGFIPYKIERELAPVVRVPVQRESRAAELAGPFFVMGRKASNLEARIYRVLKRLGWPDYVIEFQVNILGGKLPGGSVLDFVVRTFGIPVIIEPNGDYWHQMGLKKQKDKERFQQIEQAWRGPFKYFVYGQEQISTDEMAYHRLLIDIGRGGA